MGRARQRNPQRYFPEGGFDSIRMPCDEFQKLSFVAIIYSRESRSDNRSFYQTFIFHPVFSDIWPETKFQMDHYCDCSHHDNILHHSHNYSFCFVNSKTRGFICYTVHIFFGQKNFSCAGHNICNGIFQYFQ